MSCDSPEMWTGELLAKMHINRVRQVDLARQLGVTEAYISMLMNSKRCTKNAREKLERAYDAIITARA